MKYAEDRKEPRVPTRAFMVRVKGCSHSIFGYAKDISRSGMQLRTFSTCLPYPLGPGEDVDLEFKLPDNGTDVKCSAQVVWTRTPDGGPYTVMLQGVKFTGMAPAHQNELSGWLESRI